ncbi:MAG: diguanylate cyclase [Thermodesulfobacteriota bacterium]
MSRFAIFQQLWTKLAVMTTIVILFVSIATGIFFIRYERSLHVKELKERGVDIMTGLASHISEHLIHDNRWEIYKYLSNLVTNGGIVDYAILTDLNGEIIAHSNPKSFPMGTILNDPVTMKTLSAKDILFQPVGKSLYDIAYPIYYDRNPFPIGIVRIGITRKYLAEELDRQKVRLVFISIIFSLIGIIGSAIFSRVLSRPLHQLSDAADAISVGKLNGEITIKRNDEIGRLVRAFNDMISNIKKSKEELEVLSITDHITGLYNHRHFYRLMIAEFEKSKRYNYPIACLMFDVDYFKSINDTHGHEFGNLVLKELGILVSSELRSTDTIARYGGDEFLILLPYSEKDSACSFADKIRKNVERHRFSKGTFSIATTISIGISIFPEEQVNTPDDMIKYADTALYRAKMNGRNRIDVWTAQKLTEDHIATDRYNVTELKEDFSKLTMNIKKAYMESTISLIKCLDSKDEFSSKHSYNVTIYALKLANKIGLPEKELSALRYAAILHDIGKIGVQEEVLKKKGSLTDGEFEAVKKHPMIAANIMEEMKFWDREIPIIRHHHERYDGLGYPDKLVEKNIPIGARILHLVDAFDAIVSERSYKGQKSTEEAINEIRACSGTQFDPELVELFIEMIRKGEI